MCGFLADFIVIASFSMLGAAIAEMIPRSRKPSKWQREQTKAWRAKREREANMPVEELEELRRKAWRASGYCDYAPEYMRLSALVRARKQAK